MNALEQLNARHAGADYTTHANAGNWSAAADCAAKWSMWGVWEMCRREAGLPYDTTAQDQVIAEMMAARRARFAKR